MGFENTDSIRLYCDNGAIINIAHNPVQHDRTKHVGIDRHFSKEKLNSGTNCTLYVKIGEQLVDILTKGVGSRPFHFALSKLGLRDLCTRLRGSVGFIYFLIYVMISEACIRFFYYY